MDRQAIAFVTAAGHTVEIIERVKKISGVYNSQVALYANLPVCTAEVSPDNAVNALDEICKIPHVIVAGFAPTAFPK